MMTPRQSGSEPLPSAPPPATHGWRRKAARGLAIFAGVVVSVFGVLAVILFTLATALPSYPDDVLVPAQADLQQGARDMRAAQAAANVGDYAQARQILQQAKANETAFVENVLGSAPPGPLLDDVHQDVVVLYGTLDAGIDKALACLDDLERDVKSADSTACTDGAKLLATTREQSDVIRAKLDEVAERSPL